MATQLDTSATDIDAIVGTIARLVHEVIGEDLDFDLDIAADSSFSEDIELESIEFVALGEQLQLTYGEKIDLVGWFGELDLDEIIDLTVGELAEFIAACLADDGPPPRPGATAVPEVEVGDLRIHYQRLGTPDGETVVMLHGMLVDNLSSLYLTLAPVLVNVGHGRAALRPAGPRPHAAAARRLHDRRRGRRPGRAARHARHRRAGAPARQQLRRHSSPSRPRWPTPSGCRAWCWSRPTSRSRAGATTWPTTSSWPGSASARTTCSSGSTSSAAASSTAWPARSRR